MPQTNNQTVSPIKIVANKIVKPTDKNNEIKTKKRSLSNSPPQSPTTRNINKSKKFVTPNRYSILAQDDSEPIIADDTDTVESLDHQNPAQTNTTNDAPKEILPPPMFIKGVIDFFQLRNSFIEEIGPNSFSCKSTSNYLKIQTNNPDNYRKLIHFLKGINAQFHTYQLQADKPLRIVIRNLHPSTPVTDIASAIEEIGHSVRNVINIKHAQTKIPLPLFFADLDPQGSDSDIFSITNLLHTKIKIEEPHKKRQIPQCQNCQSYGHTRTYCAHNPKCVKCGNDHPTSSCVKSPDLPAKCALCEGAHPANYRGCTIYKQLSQRRSNISSKKSNLQQPFNFKTTHQPHHQQSNNEHLPNQRTYANVTEGHPPLNNIPPPTNNNELSFSKFIEEFKSIINPLISLLTTLISSLISNKNAN